MTRARVRLSVSDHRANHSERLARGPSSVGACQVEGTVSAAGSGGPDGSAGTTRRLVTPTSSAPNAGMRTRLLVKVSNASVAVLALGVKKLARPCAQIFLDLVRTPIRTRCARPRARTHEARYGSLSGAILVGGARTGTSSAFLRAP